MASKRQVTLLIEKYERIAKDEIVLLKKLVREISELEAAGQNAQHLRSQARRLEEQLLNGIEQILSTREKLETDCQEDFDTLVEPIRKLIQTTVNTFRQLKPPALPFYDPVANPEEEPNIYAEELLLQMNGDRLRQSELKNKVEETKKKAAETQQLEADIQDLNEIFGQLQALVHQQHDMVDSIEEHVEQAANDVRRGNDQLRSAVKSKNAKVPIATAVVGGLALGGPVGIAAGSTIAGVAAALGGAFAGLYGGRWIKKSNSPS